MSSANYKIAITPLLDEEPLGHFIVVDGENKPYYIGLLENSSISPVSPDVHPSVSTIRVKCYHKSNSESAGYVTLPGIVYDASNSNFINDINTLLNIVGFAVDESEPVSIVEISNDDNIDEIYNGHSVLLTLSYVGTNDVRNYIFHGVLPIQLMDVKDNVNELNDSLFEGTSTGLSSIFVSDNGNRLWAIVRARLISTYLENVSI